MEKEIMELKRMSHTSRMQYLNDLPQRERAVIEAQMLVCQDRDVFMDPCSPKDKEDMKTRLEGSTFQHLSK